jgi:hypothetical protein
MRSGTPATCGDIGGEVDGDGACVEAGVTGGEAGVTGGDAGGTGVGAGGAARMTVTV